MTLRLIGANPCVTLFDGNRAVAYVSVWRVDWSEHGGTGHALVVGQQGSVRVVGADPNLSMWLAASFNRHLVSVSSGIAWTEPDVTTASVTFDLDLATGLRAAGDDILVEISDPIDRILTRNDAYDLGGTPNVLSTVWIPCATGAITVDGRRLTGEPRVDAAAPMSSAFIAEAEVWGWTTGEHRASATVADSTARDRPSPLL